MPANANESAPEEIYELTPEQAEELAKQIEYSRIPESERGKATRKCINAISILGLSHYMFLMIHKEIRNKYIEQRGAGSVGTMGVTCSGTVFIDTDFVAQTDNIELGGVIAHELLHIAYKHWFRVKERDSWVWNIATDMCINHALRASSIRLPKEALYPPNEYSGDLFAETLYEWLLKNPRHIPAQPKVVKVCAGCSVKDDGLSNEKDWRQIVESAIRSSKMAGRGSTALEALFEPRTPKINWRQIIRSGVELTCARPSRDDRTFARRNRRSKPVGPQLPGWRGNNPRLAVIVDVSGSMDRKWFSEIAAEIKHLIHTFDIRIYLVAHTSKVEWEGWVTSNTQAKLAEAFAHSGGTDPQPAYDAVKKIGKMDAIVHFTDTEFFGTWPEVPARNLVVGAFQRQIATQPPPGAKIIHCAVD